MLIRGTMATSLGFLKNYFIVLLAHESTLTPLSSPLILM